MEPNVDGQLKPQKKRAKKPDEVVRADDDGNQYLERVRPDEGQEASTAALASTPKRDQKRLITQNTQTALVMLAEGYSVVDIASHLGYAPSTVIGWITKHKRRVKLGEIDKELDQIAVPLAKDNLIHGLLAGDKDYTLETLKGRGHLRRYTAGEEVVKHELPPLRVVFERGDTGNASGTLPESSQVIEGHVVGRPALPPASEES